MNQYKYRMLMNLVQMPLEMELKGFLHKGGLEVYTTTFNKKMFISVLTTINANGDFIPNYYMFKELRPMNATWNSHGEVLS